ncbi:hypothetical protein TSUD_242210 [Trifolium subterraneum]|uniref:Uncharacterized protein n=1 Tax=Trifolium subterraneum TaxID=3900 RepID=A0A2Z6MXE8_TRISU|nr:hypothetical protein TSUD_242210 [Trifolium subterraneum]
MPTGVNDEFNAIKERIADAMERMEEILTMTPHLYQEDLLILDSIENALIQEIDLPGKAVSQSKMEVDGSDKDKRKVVMDSEQLRLCYKEHS